MAKRPDSGTAAIRKAMPLKVSAPKTLVRSFPFPECGSAIMMNQRKIMMPKSRAASLAWKWKMVPRPEAIKAPMPIRPRA